MGRAATAENDFAYRLAAQARRAGLRRPARVRADAPGQDERLLLPGLQPAAVVPQPRQDHRGAVEAQVPGHHRSAADRDGALLGEPRRVQRRRSPRRSRPRCSSCRPTCFAEDEGSLVNSGRWLQWHWAGGTPPGEAKYDIWIMAQLYLRLKALYQKEGGSVPEPILNLHWRYKDPDEPDAGGARQGAQRLRGRRHAGSDRSDQAGARRRASRSPSFAALRDDGSTACGCWIYSGCFNEAGNNMARRDNTDPDDTGAFQMGVLVAGQPAHPLQPRLGRSAGQAVGSQAQADRVGRREVDRLRRARHRARPPSRTWSGPSS